MSGRFPRIRFLPSIALLLFEFAFAQQAGLSGQAGTAQNISAQQTPDQSRYLDELQVKREENWFQREIRRFRTYPHLVRAYQLIDQGRLVEARQELENYLKIDPQDLQVRLNYVTLLYRMKDFAAAVGQSSLILETKPVFVPALLYRGMGRQELGQRQEAMADFKTAAGSANIQPSDRIFALNMIADLAIRQKSHSQALTALTTLNKSKEEFANYFRIGIVFDQLNRLGESEAAFQKAFRLAAQPSERVQALRAIGVLAEKRQDLNSAKKALQASLAIKPSDPNLIRFLAQTTYELAFRQKLYSEALAALSHVGDSTDFGTLLRRGLALEKQNRVSEAESAYLSAIKLAGTEAEQARIYRSLGDLAKHRGDLQQAEKSFLEAWRLDPQNRDAIRALADIAYRQKDYGQAVKWSRQLSALSSSPADREILANTLYAAKDYQGAILEYRRVLSQVKNTEDLHRIYTALGNSYTSLGKLTEASEAFNEALKIQRDEMTLAAAAESLEREGQTERAIELRNELLQRNPGPEGHYKLGVLYARAGDSIKAIPHLEQAVRGNLAPELRALAFKQEGFLYQRLNRYSEARKAFENALALNGSDPAVYQALGEVDLQLGAYDDAIAILHRGLSIQETTAGFKTLALAEERAGHIDRALAIYEGLLTQASEHSAAARELQVSIANLKFKRGGQLASLSARRGEYSDAAVRFLEAFDRSGRSNWSVLVQAAESLALAQRWEMAAEIDKFLLGLQNLPGERRGEVVEKLAFAQANLGQYTQAVESFQKAIELGRGSWQIRQNLGIILYKLKRWPEALEQFKASEKLEPVAATLVYLGRTYKELGKPGLAVHYMSHALQHTDQLTPKDQKDLYNDLGYLLADENEYERAAEVWSKSVELEPDPVIMLRMARMYRLGGNLPRAEDVLAQIDPNKLPPRMQAEQLDELAAIKGSQGQLEEAIATLSKANALEPAASRYHQAGMMYSRLDRNRAAIEYLEKARSLDPKNNEYAIALAYAYKNARRFRDAAALFEEAVKHDPDNAALYRELGYVEMRDNNNERAGAWLKKAIDAELANTPGSLSSKLKVEVYGMRRDLGRLTQTYDVTAYLTYRSSSLAQGSIPSFLAGGVLPSQGGLEFSYQPPRFGFRDERIFQFFGRLLWNIQPDSLEFDTKSYQGGIGFRYKPARSQNLYLSGERIFKIGSLAEDHWLLRTSYSWDYGYDLKPDRPMWNYTFLYGDTGFFADKPRALVYFVEGRQGITWRLGDSFLITPHFIIDARYQNPRALNASYWEGGLGVSIRYLFNETRYEAPRSSSELLIHYKNGLFFGNPRSFDTSFSGLVITGAFHF